MAIPLLFELRTVLDWIFVKTSLTFREWVQVEAIYAQVYNIKMRRIRNFETKPRGSKYPNINKLMTGGLITTILIGVLWFPLLFFAYSSFGESNVPVNAKISLQLGYFEPFYRGESADLNIHQFTEKEFDGIKSYFKNNEVANEILEDYDHKDIVALQFNVFSFSSWELPPPLKQQLISDIETSRVTNFDFDCVIAGKATNVRNVFQVEVSHDFNNTGTAAHLKAMLEQPKATDPILIPFILPKIIRIYNNGKSEVITNKFSADGSQNLNLTLKLNTSPESQWWEIKEPCDNLFDIFPYQNCEETVTIFLFSEKLIPAQLNMFAIKG
jgi:piezo-type mechanosensitive ion channel component 1/2